MNEKNFKAQRTLQCTSTSEHKEIQKEAGLFQPRNSFFSYFENFSKYGRKKARRAKNDDLHKNLLTKKGLTLNICGEEGKC